MLNIMKQQGNANQNYLTPVSMTIIKKTIRSIGKELEEGEHSWESKLVQLIWKTIWSFLKKLKIELPYDPAIPLSEVFIQRIHKH